MFVAVVCDLDSDVLVAEGSTLAEVVVIARGIRGHPRIAVYEGPQEEFRFSFRNLTRDDLFPNCDRIRVFHVDACVDFWVDDKDVVYHWDKAGRVAINVIRADAEKLGLRWA
jgi:hypothetical protein